MTERLYYTDSYLQRFSARVIQREQDGRHVTLDRSAFYPTSGGQLHDTGTINGIPVLDVRDEGDHVIQILERPLQQDDVEAEIDWPRRFDLMQQHSGQHLLSAILAERWGWPTVSVHMGEAASTVELDTADVTDSQAREIEVACQDEILANRPITLSIEEASQAIGLRKASDRSGPLRIVTIDTLDRSACGGTHVRSTGEIGLVLLRGVERIRGHVRLTFHCGGRALRRSAQEWDSLSAVARLANTGWEQVPAAWQALQQRSKDSEREKTELLKETAPWVAQQWLVDAVTVSSGVQVAMREAGQGIGERERLAAQAVAGLTQAVVLLWHTQGTVLLAASQNSGVHAGNVLKAALSAEQGRGGGSVTLAQGSVAEQRVHAVVASIRETLAGKH